MSTTKKVMVFGVFDRLHPGHHYLLKQARSHGNELIVVVARNSSVRLLKNKEPRESEEERLQKVRAFPDVSEVLLGDETLGTYEVFKSVTPQLICLGYDQVGLERNLREKMTEGMIPTIPMIKIEAYYPDKFRSSIWEGEGGL